MSGQDATTPLATERGSHFEMFSTPAVLAAPATPAAPAAPRGRSRSRTANIEEADPSVRTLGFDNMADTTRERSRDRRDARKTLPYWANNEADAIGHKEVVPRGREKKRELDRMMKIARAINPVLFVPFVQAMSPGTARAVYAEAKRMGMTSVADRIEDYYPGDVRYPGEVNDMASDVVRKAAAGSVEREVAFLNNLPKALADPTDAYEVIFDVVDWAPRDHLMAMWSHRATLASTRPFMWAAVHHVLRKENELIPRNLELLDSVVADESAQEIKFTGNWDDLRSAFPEIADKIPRV
jgi:hypothetical protein